MWSFTKICNFCKTITFIKICIYLLKVNNRNIRARCEICSKLTIKTPERRHWCRFDFFIVNFEHISHLVLVFLLLNFNMWLPAGKEFQPLTVVKSSVIDVDRILNLAIQKVPQSGKVGGGSWKQWQKVTGRSGCSKKVMSLKILICPFFWANQFFYLRFWWGSDNITVSKYVIVCQFVVNVTGFWRRGEEGEGGQKMPFCEWRTFLMTLMGLWSQITLKF